MNAQSPELPDRGNCVFRFDKFFYNIITQSDKKACEEQNISCSPLATLGNKNVPSFAYVLSLPEPAAGAIGLCVQTHGLRETFQAGQGAVRR